MAAAAAGRPGISRGWSTDRLALLAFLAVLDALNALWPSLARSWDGGAARFLLGAGGISAVIWFCLYAIWAIGHEPDVATPASGADMTAAALMLLAAMLPAPTAAALALSGAAIYLVAIGRSGSRERRLGLVLLALGNTLLWGRLLLSVVAPAPLLRLDAALVSAISGLPAAGNIVSFSDRGQFYIAPGCSSLHNVSLAILLWASATQLLGLRVTPRLLASCGTAMLAMVLVNAVRLTAIGYFHADFQFLHEGPGKDLFGFASLLICGLIVAAGIASEARRAL